MISEILFASVKEEVRTDRSPGLSGSQLYPCPYRMLLVEEGKTLYDPPTPQGILNMADGWDQEEQTVKRLAKAGVKIFNRQAKIQVGKSNIPGSIDGEVNLKGKDHLWEHKAWNTDSFTFIKSKGLEGFPGVKAQVNAYMLGMGLNSCYFMVKHKDSNDYFDLLENLDKDFILSILEWADKIRLEGWKPEPKKCEYCRPCGIGCFDIGPDFSKIASSNEKEMAEKWIKGKQLSDVGGMMMDEAKGYFCGAKDKYGQVLLEGIIGNRDTLIVEGLVIRKVVQNRFDISKQRIVQEFGPEGLARVGEDKRVEFYTIREVA